MNSIRFNRRRMDDRAINELIGITKGIIADNHINNEEATFLKHWLEANLPCSEDQMVNHIYRRVQEMLIDQVLQDDERTELMQLLKMFSGYTNSVDARLSLTSTLPLDDPQPPIIFHGSVFCLTGTFAYGPRRICTEIIISLGGAVNDKITLATDYLITGYLGSPDWIHSTHGRKIEKALQYREANGSPAIVSEDHWIQNVLNHE